MSIKKVKYVDTYCYGAFHEMFNASLLTLCVLATDRVDYTADRHTIMSVLRLSKGCFDREKLYVKRIFVPAGYGRPIPVMIRYVCGALRNMLYVVSTSSSVPLIFNYNNAFALRGVNWLSRLFHRKVIVFCHGEIELLSPDCKEHKGLITRLLQRRLEKFFVRRKKKFAAGLKFVVLGDSILINLKSRISSAAFEQFRSIDHPYLFTDDQPTGMTNPALQKGILTLGTIGTMKPAKGLDNFRQFLDLAPDSLSVKVIGRLEGDATGTLKGYGVEITADDDSFLPRAELDRQLGQLDYILYFYYPDSYRLIASGAIFDAITAGKPVIALRNDFFDYLFRKFGEFGYLESTPTAIAERVKSLVADGDSRYAEFRTNIERIRVCLHPNGMVPDFIRLLDFKA